MKNLAFKTVFIVCLFIAANAQVDEEDANTDTTENKELLYDGYQVLRVHAENIDQLLYLRHLSETEDNGPRINFWSEPNRINSSVDVMVSPDIANEMKTNFGKKNMSTLTLINDVGR